MSPEIKAQPQDERYEEQIIAEWANVGLCGEMFRPVSREEYQEEELFPIQYRPWPVVDEADWQPHGRCCL